MEAKRTEKLVSALYLVTSFFDEKEPMKWRLRELGGYLISHRDNRNVVLEIMSLLTVGKNAGLISDTNHGIIYKEFSALVPHVETLGDIFKRIEDREEPKTPTLSGKSDESSEKPSYYLASSISRGPVIKDKIHREADKVGVVAQKKSGRQSVILSLLKKKKEIQVADVSPLIEGVSEKTIQRELLAMVSSGILRKEGEKRWSRYSLAE